MGLTITANYKNAIYLSGSYGILVKIREKVAFAFDKEFGEHYATLKTGDTDEFYKEFDKKTNEIFAHERFKEEDTDLVEFFFASDCKGKISYRTCKKIYELIKNDNNEYQLRYAFYSKNDWQDFKQLLLDCYKHKANLNWQ